jgi:hydrogenase maturation protein HypF
VSATSARVRTRVRVEGTVQGVGFRPFVYRIASEEGLAGHVLNDERGVLLEAEGDAAAVARFVSRLSAETPPLAVVERVRSDSLEVRGERGFRILQSASTGTADAPVAPDTATCRDCLSELLDPADRRHRYPFVNCTNCGPRFTIVRGVPYDRPLTTMSSFAMCDDCRREYEDPLDRRFHAQPNACAVCGPRVGLIAADGSPVRAADGSPPQPGEGPPDPVAALAERLAAGAIAAVKGIGGYHLVCDAGDERAVAALRSRKHREDKPFALMVADVAAARCLVHTDEAVQRLLASPARPIVLATRLPGAPVAPSVAPGAPELGVMLPYSPLHHLLIRDFAAASRGTGPALVMTSGNVSDEPIAYRDQDALVRLAPIADIFLIHDREIETRTDDSVVRSVRLSGAARTLTLRRSRGYVPGHLALPVAAERPLLACGAEQKSTFCLARGTRAWVGHHIGDLEQFATLEAFRTGIDHFERLFAVLPEVVAHDPHPGYLSTAYALEREGVECVAVQHHHAHLAACLAEHGLGGPAVGAIFDGTGYGLDGTVWGGELLVGDLTGFERAGSLWPVPMPGAAAAIRQPWRMAHAWLSAALGEPPSLPPALNGRVEQRRWASMTAVGASPDVSPVTSSMGRLFDAVGALCGLAAEVSYEGQAAVELEAAAWTVSGAAVPPYEIELIRDEDGLARIDPRAAVRQIADELAGGGPPGIVAARFHTGLAAVTVTAVSEIASARELETAVLSGGVFQNRLLLQTVAAGLQRAGLRVLIPERLPPNDGGISFGQAAVAAADEAHR